MIVKSSLLFAIYVRQAQVVTNNVEMATIVLWMDEIGDQGLQSAKRLVLRSSVALTAYRIRLAKELFPVLLDDVLEVLSRREKPFASIT